MMGMKGLAVAVVIGAGVLLNVATASAITPANQDWSLLRHCPAADPVMLAVPAGQTSECVLLGGSDAGLSFNIGDQTFRSGGGILLSFGVPGTEPGNPTVGNVDLASDTPQLPPWSYDWPWLGVNGGAANSLIITVCEVLAIGQGPVAFPNCYAELVGLGSSGGSVTDVQVKIELAGAPSAYGMSSLVSGGPVLTVPVFFQLSNPVLGTSCTVGTPANPIVLHLVQSGSETTGPDYTGPDPDGYPVQLASLAGGTIADTSFAEPGATGCGPSGALDSVVNALLGLPSAAGKNSLSSTGGATTATTTAGGSVLAQALAAGVAQVP